MNTRSWTVVAVVVNVAMALACGGGEVEPSEPPVPVSVREPASDPPPSDPPPSAQPASSPAAPKPTRSKGSLLGPSAWPRMKAVHFGCMLQDAGARVDRRWQCGAAPTTDNAGPEFPSSLLGKLPTQVKEVDLSWEHGELQAVTLVIPLSGGIDQAAARRVFEVDRPPQNVMYADVQDCARDAYCVVLQGFDHQGAGD